MPAFTLSQFIQSATIKPTAISAQPKGLLTINAKAARPKVSNAVPKLPSNRAIMGNTIPPRLNTLNTIAQLVCMAASGSNTPATTKETPAIAAATMPAAAAIFIIVLAVFGFCAAQMLSFSFTSPIHDTTLFSSGAIASPMLARKLVNVPVAASHKLLSVPSCSFTRWFRLACASILAANSL